MALETSQIAQLRSRTLPVCADGDMVFKEPWEARAFSLIVSLSQAGHFTWSEWVDCFAVQVTKATDVEAAGQTPKTYYEQWVDAAEALLSAKGLVTEEQLFARRLGAIQPTAAQEAATARRIPLGRTGIDSECGNVAVFLASKMSEYVTGTAIPVDGGTWASSGWLRNKSGKWTLVGDIES